LLFQAALPDFTMVRLVSLSFAGAIFGCGASSHIESSNTGSQNSLEQTISQWVQGQVGTRVGDGECSSLLEGAEDVARSAGFTVPKMTRHCYSDSTIYCWSDNEINYEDMQAGDFVQFKGWYERVTTAHGWHSKTADHHSAVVRAPFDGTTLKVWEQNPGAVDEGDYHPYVGTGEIHVFRMGGGGGPSPAPAPAPSPAPSPSPSGGCQDSPSSWANTDGEGCHKYERANFCTKSGGEGSGWRHGNWGSITDWADSQGRTALDACCACGGGAGDVVV